MMRALIPLRSKSLILAVALFAFIPPGTHADNPPLFEEDILPILRARCLKCHGEGKVQGGLDLRRRFTILEGGDGGPGLVPGKPGESLLLQRIEKNEMPPLKEGSLDKRQVELIRRWVAAGAPVAKSPEPPLEAKEKVTRITAADRNFWAFQAPKRPPVPPVRAKEKVRNPIDAFLLAKLEAKGLTFNPVASREVLLRRVTLDLTGLPPTPKELEEFLADQRPNAYERVVERLLASPAYGERAARHWLDWAGYADSDGYLAADRLRPEAWRYRDYVIQALNADMPYDQFLTEQLAGDELSDWRRAEKLTPEMTRQLTATGFLRTALDPTYPGYTEPNEIHQVLSDTMQIVSTTFLGLTMHCARCHDHKLDPITQRDYYSLQSVLLPALDPARWQPSGVRGIRLAGNKEWAEIQNHNRQVDERVKPLTAKLTQLTAKAGKAPSATAKAELDKLKAEIAKETAQKRPLPVVLRGLSDLDGPCPEGRVLRRGDYNKPGAVVHPGVPEVLTPAGFQLPVQPGEKTSGRRLALARWLTDPNNPLTARVQVNRMWAQHFGRGLVATLANFGRSGARPAHPELLDWLAVEFRDPSHQPPPRSGEGEQSDLSPQPPALAGKGVGGRGSPSAPPRFVEGLGRGSTPHWSMKTLHRLLVTSTAYRQSSTVDRAKLAADPNNLLLGWYRPRRLDGEAIRDSILAVSGKLTEQRFGAPVAVKASSDGSVDTADDAQGNRRSIYVIVRRSQHLTLLDLFDTPMMEINCPERNLATTPLQTLALLHGPFTQRNAVALAERILKSASGEEERLRLAFQLTCTREPRPAEVQRLRSFLAAVLQEESKQAPAAAERQAWTQLALVLLNSNEFLYMP